MASGCFVWCYLFSCWVWLICFAGVVLLMSCVTIVLTGFVVFVCFCFTSGGVFGLLCWVSLIVVNGFIYGCLFYGDFV